MAQYEKPIITLIGDTFEGIYAASGSSCYVTTAHIHQIPEAGRGDYRIQINGQHNADHTKEAQHLIISFNQPVKYKSSNGTCNNTEGTVLTIDYYYHQNPIDNIGLGDLVVESDPNLCIINAEIFD